MSNEINLRKLANALLSLLPHKMAKSNKGQQFALAALGSLATLLVIGYVTAAIGTRVVERVDDTLSENTVADNITSQGGQGLQQFAEFGPIICLVVVAAVVLTIVRSFLS